MLIDPYVSTVMISAVLCKYILTTRTVIMDLLWPFEFVFSLNFIITDVEQNLTG